METQFFTRAVEIDPTVTAGYARRLRAARARLTSDLVEAPRVWRALEDLLESGGEATVERIDRALGPDFAAVDHSLARSTLELLTAYQDLTSATLDALDAPPNGVSPYARRIVLAVMQRATYLSLGGRLARIPVARPRRTWTPPAPRNLSGWRGYVIEAAGVVAATVVQAAVWPIIGPVPYLLFFPMLIVVSFFGAGWFALVMSIAVTHLLNTGSFTATPHWPGDYLRAGLFVGAGVMILTLRMMVRQAQARAREEHSRSVVFAELQKALADVGQIGVRQSDVGGLLDGALPRIAEGLGATVVKVLEYEPVRRVFLIRATFGLDGCALESEITPTDDPQAFFTLSSAAPVTVGSFADERRFPLPPCLRPRGIRAGVSVAIPGPSAPYGVLLIYTTTLRTFTADEESFAATVAGTLANAIERRRGEVRLRDLNAELARSNAELNRFAAIAAHDLKAPLNSVSQFAELIEASAQLELGPRTAGYLKIISRATDRMRDLVDRLLAYSRVGAHGLPFVPIDCAEVVTAVVQDLRASVDRVNAEIRIGPLPTVDGDEIELRQLFQNLISNAIKFVGDDKPLVIVEGETRADHWRFGVTDNGIGIDPSEAAEVFEPFRRLRAGSFEGSGLGLAICLRIVERHGGTIWMESSPGVGSSFYFTLPRRPVP